MDNVDLNWIQELPRVLVYYLVVVAAPPEHHPLAVEHKYAVLLGQHLYKSSLSIGEGDGEAAKFALVLIKK